MSQKQAGRYCAHCQKNVMATGTAPNHLLHLDSRLGWQNRRISLHAVRQPGLKYRLLH